MSEEDRRQNTEYRIQNTSDRINRIYRIEVHVQSA